MAKKLSVAKEAEKCAVLLQKLVRLKAADDNGYAQCVTCNAVKHYKELQGGHYMSRGCSATKLLLENVHPQCAGCNGFGMKYGDKEKVYLRYMEDTYGKEFVQELEAMKHKPFKWNRFDIEEKAKDFKAQIKEHEARIN